MQRQTTDVINADVLDWAASYDGPKFHAVLCDPPYNYQFMGKDWDDAVAMHSETWTALAQHLFPGAFVMAFGVLVGTYSSIFIASPILIGWESFMAGLRKVARIVTFRFD